MSRRAFQKRQRELGHDLISTTIAATSKSANEDNLETKEKQIHNDNEEDDNNSFTNTESQEEPEEDDDYVPASKPSMFALLGMDDDDENDQDSEEEEKLQIETTKIEPVLQSLSNSRPSSSSKNKKNKRKQKNLQSEKPKNQNEDNEEDIDEIIREIEKINTENDKQGNTDDEFIINPDESNETISTISGSSVETDLLSVETKNLDAEAEMKRIFGSRVINQESSRNSGKGFRSVGRKLIFAKPTDTWPRFTKLAVSMEFVERNQDMMYFKYTHAKMYQEIQCKFLDCIETHDPATIQTLLRIYPYHIDSVIQISEVLKHSGDIGMASHFIERALYVFEKAFHSMFNVSLGKCRLSYLIQENRSFFIALFKHIEYIARKGCWRTCFEYCKLVYSLNPDEDPVGMLLCFDYYALRADMFDWFTKAYSSWKESKKLEKYPNWLYSLALGYKMKGNDNLSRKFIRMALSFFPTIVVPLLDKLGTQEPTIISHPHLGSDPESDSIRLLTRLYVERSHTLWKEYFGWLRQECSLFIQDYNKGIKAMKQVMNQGRLIRERLSSKTEFPRQFLRHVHISDLGSIPSLMPSSFLVGENITMYDPWRPLNAPQSVYDEYIERRKQENAFAASSVNPYRNTGVINAFLSSIFPWLNVQGVPDDPVAQQVLLENQNNGDNNNNNQQLRETMEEARALFPMMFPEGQIDVNNPQWMQRLAEVVRERLGFGDLFHQHEGEDDEFLEEEDRN